MEVDVGAGGGSVRVAVGGTGLAGGRVAVGGLVLVEVGLALGVRVGVAVAVSVAFISVGLGGGAVAVGVWSRLTARSGVGERAECVSPGASVAEGTGEISTAVRVIRRASTSSRASCCSAIRSPMMPRSTFRMRSIGSAL